MFYLLLATFIFLGIFFFISIYNNLFVSILSFSLWLFVAYLLWTKHGDEITWYTIILSISYAISIFNIFFLSLKIFSTSHYIHLHKISLVKWTVFYTLLSVASYHIISAIFSVIMGVLIGSIVFFPLLSITHDMKEYVRNRKKHKEVGD